MSWHAPLSDVFPHDLWLRSVRRRPRLACLLSRCVDLWQQLMRVLATSHTMNVRCSRACRQLRLQPPVQRGKVCSMIQTSKEEMDIISEGLLRNIVHGTASGSVTLAQIRGQPATPYDRLERASRQLVVERLGRKYCTRPRVRPKLSRCSHAADVASLPFGKQEALRLRPREGLTRSLNSISVACAAAVAALVLLRVFLIRPCLAPAVTREAQWQRPSRRLAYRYREHSPAGHILLFMVEAVSSHQLAQESAFYPSHLQRLSCQVSSMTSARLALKAVASALAQALMT